QHHRRIDEERPVPAHAVSVSAAALLLRRQTGRMRRYTVHVKPGSKRPGIDAAPDGSLTVRVAARAIDGAANAAVIKAVAAHLGVPRSRLSVRRGHTSRTKQIEVAD